MQLGALLGAPSAAGSPSVDRIPGCSPSGAKADRRSRTGALHPGANQLNASQAGTSQTGTNQAGANQAEANHVEKYQAGA